ncbi:MAG: hypothetical protein SH850_23385 [Planctomycetaceae bacterium]|nr:hypothetical protein [Planctomycetaceae bacterium]
MRMRLAVGGLLVLLGLVAVEAAPSARAVRLNIVFVTFCDGLDVAIRDRLGVTGRHTGCGQNELVRGNQFTTPDGETGVTVTFLDQTIGRRVRIEVFQTGFRAGNFYEYDVRTETLLRYGDWQPAPPPI